jgi:ribosomal protein S12 methylthiotransferase
MQKLMRRKVSKKETYELIQRFRVEVPGIVLRTTLLVGHPGETEADFEELKQFVRDIRFERLGVFPYSHEENTYAWDHYEDTIPEEVKQQRADEIMEIQQQISLELNQERIDSTVKVLIDRREGEYYIGRSEYDSPEVDNELLIKTTKRLQIGTFRQVRIIEADEYDLYAEPV